jgi:predicted nuclease of predicted toxin-antitoxin system
MRLLLDSCLSPALTEALREAGHDVESTLDWPRDPGDSEILRIAFESNRVLITLDKDFGELVYAHGQDHAGVLRLASIPSFEHAAACLLALENYGRELEAGAFVVYEVDGVRIRE